MRARGKKTMLLAVLGIFFSGAFCSAEGLWDSVSDSLSKAADAVIETTDDVVDSAKSMGEDIGILDKEEKQDEKKQQNNTKPGYKYSTSPASTEPAKTPPQAQPKDEVTSPQTAEVAAKLPGGVTSRIKKMDQELDKVKKKLEVGAGTSVDRAKRAELDLKRAEKYMAEIEKRYEGQYAPEHPEMVAAKDRLKSAQTSWKKAMNLATEEVEEAARIDEMEEQAEKAKKEEIARKQQEEENTREAEKKASEASCDGWSEKLEQYMGGEKGLVAYRTDDQQQMAAWRVIYAEAEETLNEYPAGLCGRADGYADYVRTKLADFKELDAQVSAELAKAEADKGTIIFSDKPIEDPGNSHRKESFSAGDPIYGMLKLTKPFTEIYGKKENLLVRVDVSIDGKKIHAQFITIKSSDYANRDYLVFNIAPDPSRLVAYSDQNIEYGKSTPTTVQGPNELTHHLGRLKSGSHRFDFGMYYYGKNWAEGSFTVEGDDFGQYAELHEKIAKGVVAQRTLPAAGMKSKELEKTMISLLQDAGWDNVYRLNIVDKDWWIERVDGGNTPVKSRYLAAAALSKKSDGSYFFKKCTFHQDKLITGAFGKLYLSHQGDEVPVNKENIDK